MSAFSKKTGGLVLLLSILVGLAIANFMTSARWSLAAEVLRLEAGIDPSIDVQPYLRQVQALSEKVSTLVGNSEDPEVRIRAMNTVLFQQAGFTYSDADPWDTSQISGLIDILTTKRGTCFSMPLLYIAVAHFLGYPMKAVVVPRHIFVRYDAPDFKESNIETTSGGGYLSDAEYIRKFNVAPAALAGGSYLRTLSEDQYFDIVQVNYALKLFSLGRKSEGLRIIEAARKRLATQPEISAVYEQLKNI